jgi:hypothetical protein
MCRRGKTGTILELLCCCVEADSPRTAEQSAGGKIVGVDPGVITGGGSSHIPTSKLRRC